MQGSSFQKWIYFPFTFQVLPKFILFLLLLLQSTFFFPYIYPSCLKLHPNSFQHQNFFSFSFLDGYTTIKLILVLACIIHALKQGTACLLLPPSLKLAYEKENSKELNWCKKKIHLGNYCRIRRGRTRGGVKKVIGLESLHCHK